MVVLYVLDVPEFLPIVEIRTQDAGLPDREIRKGLLEGRIAD